MNKLYTFLLILLSVSLCTQVFGQDKILDKSGNEHIVIVTEITPDSLYYREIADSVNQKVYSVHKNLLFMVTFKNGTKEVFPEETASTETPAQELPALTRDQYYKLGQQESKKYFKSSGAFWGTFAATTVPMFAIGPTGGIATGLAVGLTEPKNKNVISSKPEYKQNPDYMAGYNKQAKQKKLGSAAGGFVAGIGTAVVVLLAILVAAFN